MSFDGGRKCVIIDEADFMPNEPQALLRHFIEEYSSNCTFILTCNFPNRIIEALHSRCSVLDYTIPNDERDTMLASQVRAVLNVLSKEGVEHDKRVVGMLVKKHFPDMRRVLNELQRYSVVGKIDSGIFTVGNDTAFNELVPILKEKHFNNMRKWVAAQANLDIAQLSKKLYNHADEIFKQDAVPQLVLHLADYQYKSAFVADKEINVVAMLTSIMVDC
jgi:DNA polymerase III delta prime subunit